MFTQEQRVQREHDWLEGAIPSGEDAAVALPAPA
jgi:hypothetical protein